MPHLEWTWRHGPLSGPVHCTVGLATAALTAGLPPVQQAVPVELIAGAAAAGLGVIWWRARHGTPTSTLIYRLAVWSLGAGWFLHAITYGLDAASLFVLAAGAAVAGALRVPVARHRDGEEQRRLEASEQHKVFLSDRARQQLAVEWAERIERVCRLRVQVVGVERWVWPGPDGRPRETGYTLEAVLPATGAGWRTLDGVSDALANAAGLPPGCGVEVRPGVDRRRALVEVSTVDALADDIPIPAALTPATANDPLNLGVRRDGSPALAPIRWQSWVLVGATGSGKSNELRAILNRLLECEDVLVVVIDKNGGGLALPYLEPWASGEADRPAIAAVVDTDEEADKVMHFFGELIGARKQSQAAAMKRANDDKVPVSRRVPQIVIIADEAGSLPGSVQNGFVDISDRGRGASIRTIYCALRATNVGGYLPTPIKKQARVQIGMRVNEPEELRYLYGSNLDPADVPASGYGFVGAEDDIFVHKGYRVTPADAVECARRTAAWRPAGIEEESLALLDPEVRRIWDEVWDRHQHIKAAAAGAAASVPSGGGASRPASGGPARPAAHPGGLSGALEDMFAARDRLRDARQAAEQGGRPPADEKAEFERIMRGEVFVPLLLTLLLQEFDRTGADRMHTAELEPAIGAAEGTLGRLLPLLAVKALPHAFPRPGRAKGRGYAREGLERAAERIRAGDLAVPAEVAGWAPGAS